jgi:hypothetical protein
MAFCTAITGCSASLMYSKNFKGMQEDIGYRAPAPLAREVEYVYATGTVIDSKPRLLVASNVPDPIQLRRRSIDQWNTIASLPLTDPGKQVVTTSGLPANAPVPASTGGSDGKERLIDAADRRSEQARAAGARGDQLGARVSAGQAVVNTQMAQVDQTFSDTASMVNTYASTMNALAAVGKSTHRNSGTYMANWVVTHTGMIGPEAPANSVLRIDFLHSLTGESFQFSSDGDLLVNARLVRGDGHDFQAKRAIKIKAGKIESADSVPAGYILHTEAPFTPEQVREIDNGDFTTPPHLHQFAVLIRSAIKDLYEQSTQSP